MIPVEQAEELWIVHEQLLKEREAERLSVEQMVQMEKNGGPHFYSIGGLTRMRMNEIIDYVTKNNLNPQERNIELADYPFANIYDKQKCH